jgi:hypothetical protein
VTPVTDKVATHSWGNWSSSCGEWLNSIGVLAAAPVCLRNGNDE